MNREAEEVNNEEDHLLPPSNMAVAEVSVTPLLLRMHGVLLATAAALLDPGSLYSWTACSRM